MLHRGATSNSGVVITLVSDCASSGHFIISFADLSNLGRPQSHRSTRRPPLPSSQLLHRSNRLQSPSPMPQMAPYAHPQTRCPFPGNLPSGSRYLRPAAPRRSLPDRWPGKSYRSRTLLVRHSANPWQGSRMVGSWGTRQSTQGGASSMGGKRRRGETSIPWRWGRDCERGR